MQLKSYFKFDLEPYERRSQPDVLNILRVLATLFVFFLHGNGYVEGVYKQTFPFSFLVSLPAWAGVWIFLFLSGYLFGFGAERGKYPFSDRLKIKDLLQFYGRRLARFIPLYYAYLLFFELFTEKNFFWNNPKVLLQVLTFTFNGDGGISGMGHLWYISLAMQLYLIMPFVYFLVNKIKKNYILATAFSIFFVGGLALRLVRYPLPWYSEVYTNFFCNIDFVVCGIIASVLVKRYFAERKPSKIFKIIAAAFFALLVMFNCYLYYYDMRRGYMVIYQYILPTAYILGCSLLTFAFGSREKKIVRKNIPSALLAVLNTGINSFAKNSYGFYIFHIMTFRWLERTLLTLSWYQNAPYLVRYFGFFIPAFLITLLISSLFNRIAEAPKKTKSH